MNKLFGFMVAVQFFVSTANLCTGCFNLSTINPSNRYFWSIVFTINAYIFQIFLYCWYGEKVIQKVCTISQENRIIYNLTFNKFKKYFLYAKKNSQMARRMNGPILYAFCDCTFRESVVTKYIEMLVIPRWVIREITNFGFV